ncbi:hypothetical protein [Brevibacillus sp. SYSU BS000544]
MEFLSSPITWLLGILFLIACGGYLLFGTDGVLPTTIEFFRNLIEYVA